MRVHRGGRVSATMRYECPVCHKKGYDRSNMKKHIKLQHNEKRVMYPCDKCEKRLTSNQSLATHLAVIHGENTAKIDHKCLICSKTFHQKSHLRTHMKGVHKHVL